MQRAVQPSVLGRITELTAERQTLWAGRDRDDPNRRQRLVAMDHELEALWDQRRREKIGAREPSTTESREVLGQWAGSKWDRE